MNTQLFMVQGTTSDAGKSTLVAGLCRILKRRGLSVAPFKPQNMALNSAVTEDGGEIGRAQALQALACGLQPSVHMNPVLLKPSSDTQAQVIIQGKALENMGAGDYHDYKKIALDAVLDSSARLCKQYEKVLVEGAGSPAEINLRKNDIANMGYAEAVDCPVVIVADIDRGGVFAHLVGTLALLSSTEQARVQGFIINRFRGDIRLLQPGLDWLEERTGKRVFGVVPYLHNLFLDAEDAISSQQILDTDKPVLNVIVPIFTRISNHTDFDALRLHPQVHLQFVSLEQLVLPDADLIILPGSKNVRRDLALLNKHGWHEKIQRHLRYGGKLMGICGGYQMLGEEVADPQGLEDAPGVTTGLGLIKGKTELQPEKTLVHSRGHLSLNQETVQVKGYEIHCGTTTLVESSPIVFDSGQAEGALSADNQIFGSYLHGIFDSASARDLILLWAGLENHESEDLDIVREKQLDRLADSLEEHLDIDALLQLSE